MTRQVTQKLNSLESQVSNGEIASFSVSLYRTGLRVKAAGSEETLQIPLLDEILTPLSIFFAGAESIAYNTFDYTSLKSFLNTPVDEPAKNGPEKRYFIS